MSMFENLSVNQEYEVLNIIADVFDWMLNDEDTYDYDHYYNVIGTIVNKLEKGGYKLSVEKIEVK